MTTVVLWVSNLEKSVKFYRALFDCQTPYVSEAFASVSNRENEVLLHLMPVEHRSEPSLGENNPIKPVFEVPSIAKAQLAAGQNGGHIKSQTQEHEAWVYADGNDPDGNVIQVREHF